MSNDPQDRVATLREVVTGWAICLDSSGGLLVTSGYRDMPTTAAIGLAFVAGAPRRCAAVTAHISQRPVPDWGEPIAAFARATRAAVLVPLRLMSAIRSLPIDPERS